MPESLMIARRNYSPLPLRYLNMCWADYKSWASTSRTQGCPIGWVSVSCSDHSLLVCSSRPEAMWKGQADVYLHGFLIFASASFELVWTSTATRATRFGQAAPMQFSDALFRDRQWIRYHRCLPRSTHSSSQLARLSVGRTNASMRWTMLEGLGKAMNAHPFQVIVVFKKTFCERWPSNCLCEA